MLASWCFKASHYVCGIVFGQEETQRVGLKIFPTEIDPEEDCTSTGKGAANPRANDPFVRTNANTQDPFSREKRNVCTVSFCVAVHVVPLSRR